LLFLTATHTIADDNECLSSFSPQLPENGQLDYSSIAACLTKIQHLSLVDQPIKKLPAEIFAKMPALSSILVKNCPLTNLDASFFADHRAEQSAKLVSLSFVNTSIVTIDAYTFKEFRTLTVLNLIGNKITKLPEGVFDGLTKLQTLKLYDNELQGLAPNIFKDQAGLQLLDLHGNQLTNFSVDLLKAAKQPVKLSLQKNLVTTFTVPLATIRISTLDLQYNKMTEVPADLAKLTGLSQLFLSHNPLELNNRSFKKLPSTLSQLFVSNVGLSRVPNPLALFSGLENLFALSIGKNSLTTLASMPYLPKLNTLMLYDNQFPDDIDFSTIKANLPRLEKIGLTQIEPLWSCAQVARMLSQLEELNIDRLFYKASTKVFGVGNNVENIGCDNTDNNPMVGQPSSQVVQLLAQLNVLEGQMTAQTEGTSSRFLKLQEALDNLSQAFEDFSICESFERCRKM
jgi:Leucine-rich repeat (LRR) protein